MGDKDQTNGKKSKGSDILKVEAFADKILDKDIGKDEIEKILLKISTYQIELEQQNEELQNAFNEIERVKQRYWKFYDLSPIAYVAINKDGIIHEANLQAGDILSVNRNKLQSSSISSYTLPTYADTLYKHLYKVIENKESDTILVWMKNDLNGNFMAKIISTPVENESEDTGEVFCLSAIISVTDVLTTS